MLRFILQQPFKRSNTFRLEGRSMDGFFDKGLTKRLEAWTIMLNAHLIWNTTVELHFASLFNQIIKLLPGKTAKIFLPSSFSKPSKTG